ncbi:MAG: 2-hydroxy-3-oxopropionate reductase [Thermoflexus sp.]|uniref:2-hydroxy-3-oxopropionate reductase n=1 Tax=Thermoflexus sp. TaxID=1969742 RepID=UPI0025E9DFAC|nr:2-hydroxy-3-oxopropionate reductase [Thermoflexus sp.]MCS6963822.1 2-hydroxy-3-oxopropionate reductase [Thermoflexus sp.]MDW8184973.1 2-hydroxy-3-oxopropionate reductase [Anaerolineae bacterium]
MLKQADHRYERRPRMERIGFIGLGVMGKPMARNLMRAGYPLVVYNRSRPPMEELAAEGAETANSPREVAERSTVVITMLPDTPDVEQVLAGPDGVFAGGRPGLIVIDMSTIDPVTAQRLAAQAAERGITMLDAPVSGGEIGAIQGTLSIMVGGDAAAFERCLPIFQAMGRNIVHMGGPGAGQVTKAANQVVVALTIAAVSEALALAAKAGVDPAKVRAALLGGFASSRVLEVHGQRILERNFRPGFRIRLHHKDLRIALGLGRAVGASLPLTALIHEWLGALVARGQGELDHSALVTLFEEWAQTEVRPS